MSDKMPSEQVERLNKLREDRIAREKARIEKLREMNLKKYNKNEPQSTIRQSVSNVSIANRSVKVDMNQATTKTNASTVKNNFHVNGTTKRPITAPGALKRPADKTGLNKSLSSGDSRQTNNKEFKPPTSVTNKPTFKVTNVKEVKSAVTEKTTVKNDKPNTIPIAKPKVSSIPNTKSVTDKKAEKLNKFEPNLARKSFAPSRASIIPKPNVNTGNTRKSMQPPKEKVTAQNSRQSVFERLYKPKIVPKENVDNVAKLKSDPDYLKKVIKDSNLIMNKRHTMFEAKKATTATSQPVRRSISAVHFKRISKSELKNCIHKWASIGEKLNKVNLNDIHEDDCVKGEVVVSAVKSERKKVKFQTPIPFNFNTPKPGELQSRLQNWLQKRGKSLDSFHHLQCFGIHHMTKDIKLPIEPPKFELHDDEDKENVPVDSDSDDDSYTENMNVQNASEETKVDFNKDKWRRASAVSDTATDYNESTDTILSSEVMHHVDELLLGALNDLTELLKEGFDWEQCARWLRAIRDRFPSAPDSAAYWECRAALEERRGDLPASVQCWEEAIAKGTEHSVVEANLDQLLDKFLQLRISPSSGRRRQADPKMLDVKNVFKSTIIRFAVQQAKLRQSNQNDTIPKFTVTPVRRSSRLSHYRTQTPLRICTSVKQAYQLGPAEFKPNRTLAGTP